MRGLLVVACMAVPACSPTPFTQVYDTVGQSAGLSAQSLQDVAFAARAAPVYDGGFVVADWSDDAPGSQRLMVRRTSSSGATLWEHEVTEIEASPGIYGVRETSAGDFLVWGYFGTVAVANDAFVVKVASNGDAVWTKTFGGPGLDYGFRLVENAGGYVFAGATNSSGAGDFDTWVVHLDANGNQVAAETFGGTGDDEAIDMVATSDGGFAVVAQNPSAAPTLGQMQVLRYTSGGSLAWNVSVGTPGKTSTPGAVAATADGGVVVSGSEYTPGPLETTSIGRLFKLSSTGAVEWHADSPGGMRTIGGAVVLASDGTIVQGRTALSPLLGPSQGSLTRYSATGTELASQSWQLDQPFGGNWLANTLVPTSDGGLALMSMSFDDGVWHEYEAIKVNAALEREWTIPWNGDPGESYLNPTLDGWFVVSGWPPEPYAPDGHTWLVRPGADGTVVPPS